MEDHSFDIFDRLAAHMRQVLAAPEAEVAGDADSEHIRATGEAFLTLSSEYMTFLDLTMLSNY